MKWLFIFPSMLAALALALVPCSCLGEVSPVKAPPPSAPILADPPEFGAWTISITATHSSKASKRGKEGKAPKSDQMECVKTGTLKRDVFRPQDGERIERWYVGQFTLAKYENSERIAIEDAVNFQTEVGTKTGSLISGPGFPGFGWLKPELYKRTEEFEGKSCYYFDSPGAQAPGPSSAQMAAFNQEVEAWIEVKTRLPVAIRTGGVTYSYQFQSPPTEVLQLPSEFATALQKNESQLRRIKELEQLQ